MAASTKAFLSLSAIALVLIAIYVPYWNEKFSRADLKNILDGLLFQERRYSVNKANRVAVGFGSCWDVVTSGVRLMELTNVTSPEYPEHLDTITSREDLARSFAYFFKNGAAGERFMEDKNLFQKLVDMVASLNSSHENLGGNAPVISQRLAQEGWEVLLASKMSLKVASTMHSSIRLVQPANNHTKDDVHLVLEFDLGEQWGEYRSPRANRFIVHSDLSNMLLETLDGFKEALDEFNPDLLVIGGLQLLDNFAFDPEIRTNRLRQLEELLQALPSSIKVHFEMASFVEERLLSDIIRYVLPYADSIGMNEQELSNLHSMLLYNNITYATNCYPRVATMLDQARVVYKILHDQKNGRTLSRLHIHTLAYQAIFSDLDGGWKHTRSAAAKAALMANRHVCASTFIDLTKAKLIMDNSFSVSTQPKAERILLKETEPVSCWFEGQVKVCVAPNLVCTNIYKTASAGDNISAAGLSLQI